MTTRGHGVIDSHLLGQIEDILTWMSLAEFPGGSMMQFNRAEPISKGYLDAANGIADLGPVAALLDENVAPRDIGNFADVAWIGGVGEMQYDTEGKVIVPRTDEEYSAMQSNKYAYSYRRVRIAPFVNAAKIFRGSAHKFPVMARTDLAIVRRSDARVKVNTLRAGWTGKRWVYADRGNDPYHVFPACRAAETCLRLALARRYSWRVCLGYEGFPTIAFATDPQGAREVFRLRDLPNGASRRKAILHWVTEHWRQRRDGELSFVREHMRGATQFHWNGLRCEVLPSQFDLEKLSEPK